MSQTRDVLAETQHAIQLIGPGQLRLDRAKAVYRPGPYQIVARIEAVGLCFSDLKLLKQFAEHPRKSDILSGISPQVLDEIPSYAPGDKPVVPGHEGVCRIVAVGDKVRHHQVGERCLVQTDYRQLRTAKGNASFGYNFDGALQEYVLMDERVVIDPLTKERFLIRVTEDLSASAVCLVEPWACVEDSYVSPERQTIKPRGRLVVVAEPGHAVVGIRESFSPDGPPASLTAVCAEPDQRTSIEGLGVPLTWVEDVAGLAAEAFDDVVYFGASRQTIETLNGTLAASGLINIVTAGKRIGEPVSVGVGRVHYGLVRWAGTTGRRAADGYASIPSSGEIRAGEKIVVVGAAGPMGQMHVIRDICSGVPDISLVATDFDENRLKALAAKSSDLAASRGVDLQIVNPQTDPIDETFSYHALMVPAGPLVAEAIRCSRDHALINIFAGLPAGTRQEIDLDTYIERGCYMFGTSGSVIRDMKIVLEKMAGGQLDVNCSVDAVAGMAGATDGMAAVENRTLAGKIVVYPMLHDMPLVPLSELADRYPTVAEKLDRGRWTKAAEDELLQIGD